MNPIRFCSTRFGLLSAIAIVATGLQSCDGAAKKAPSSFTVIEATIPDMQAAMAAGKVTSHDLVLEYLARIGTYEDKLHAAISINPHALAEADALDKERAAGHVRGPLHGIPVALKDNIMTTEDLPTSGGALAFKNYVPPYEATLVKNLRDAGAIIIAKSTMNEWANWTAGEPTPSPGGYNAVRGQSYNPYDPRADEKGEPVLETSGSSSGIGVAANLWAANVGTSTGGSIEGPANANMLVGLRPTVGRISRHGIAPLSLDQDTAGPMTRTVADAAIMLGVLEGAPDSNDALTSTCMAPANHDYTPFLKSDGLKGARIGIPRAGIYNPMQPPGNAKRLPGLAPDERESMDEAVAALKAAGAEVVDPSDLPSMVSTDRLENLALRGICQTTQDGVAPDDLCSNVHRYGMKRDFNMWLATLGDSAPVKSLTELREWNLAHKEFGAIKYGQSRLDGSDSLDIDKDKARYESDRASDLKLTRVQGIDAVIAADKLDAVMFPGASGANYATRAGYPILVVPFGMVVNRSPAAKGAQDRTKPFGVSFVGASCSEPKLLAIGYAFEQATKRRRPPTSTP